MSINYILTQYIDTAMSLATYDKLQDGTFVGRMPGCKSNRICIHTTGVRKPITLNPRRLDSTRVKTRSYFTSHQQNRSE